MSFSGPGLWYATRAAGIVALVLLTATTALGLLTAGRVSTRRWPRFLVVGLHRNISLLALVFLGAAHRHDSRRQLHLDRPAGCGRAVLVRLPPILARAGRHRLGPADRSIADERLRQRIGHRLWRVVHWCGYLCWPIALTHGLGIGTDRSQTWVFYLAIGCGCAVVAAAAARSFEVLTYRRLVR